MSAGDNTLNSIVARLLVRTLVGQDTFSATPSTDPLSTPPPASLLASGGVYSTEQFLRNYVRFMTTPGSHNDTYAETYHRMFFLNLGKGLPPEKCADDDKHNVDSAGGLVLIPAPALLAAAAQGGAAAVSAGVTQMYATHNSKRLAKFVEVYVKALHRVFLRSEDESPGKAIREAVRDAGLALGVGDLVELAAKTPGHEGDLAVIGRFGSACYIEGSLPSLLYLAGKYSETPQEALFQNANVGGENCHRGSALGALLGAAWGMAGWPKELVEGLKEAKTIHLEAEAFARAAELCATSGQREIAVKILEHP